MRLLVETTTGEIYSQPRIRLGGPVSVTALSTESIEIQFLTNGAAARLGVGESVVFGCKAVGSFSGDYLACVLSAGFTRPAADAGYYTATLDLNTSPFVDWLADDQRADVVANIDWTVTGETSPRKSDPIRLNVWEPVTQGSEGIPTTGNPVFPSASDIQTISNLGVTYAPLDILTGKVDAMYLPPGGAGSGTVESVSVTTANGISGSVATATTTPAITLSLGAITPTSVAASGTVTGSNLSGTHSGASSGTNTGDQNLSAYAPLVSPSFTTPTLGVASATSINKIAITAPAAGATLVIQNGFTLTVVGNSTLAGTNSGDQTTITGNAGSATVLQTARTINGTSFNGSANITVTAAASTLTGSTLPALSGANLTALNASAITSGTVPPANLPTATTSALGAVMVDGSSIVISGGVISATTGGSGSVTTVSVATANGFSGSVSNPTTTPAITIVAGAITPTSVTSSGAGSFATLTAGSLDAASNYVSSNGGFYSGSLYAGTFFNQDVRVASPANLTLSDVSQLGFGNSTASTPTAGIIQSATGILKITDGGAGLGGVVAGTINGLTVTTSTGTLTVPNGITLNAGTGGTLGTAAFTAASAYEAALGNPGTNGYVLSSTTGGARSWIAAGSGGSSTTKVDVFTSSGTYTKPANALSVYAVILGGGGGGGSGRRGASTSLRTGGGGGGGGAYSRGFWPASIVGATETVTVGAGGVGGARRTADDTSGAVGVAGGASLFGVLLRAGGGGGGAAGNNSGAASGGSASSGEIIGPSGTGSSGTGGSASAGGAMITFAAASGASGGGITTADAAGNGGIGGAAGASVLPTSLVGGTAGNNSSTAAGAGTSAAANDPRGGAGGGGGGGRNSGTPGDGAAGGLYGGGGGGGGAGLNGTTDSGEGGVGGDGIVIVFTSISS